MRISDWSSDVCSSDLFVDHRIGALHRYLRLERVDVGEARHPRDLFIEARIMLHRAASEREEAEVDRIILSRQARVMPDRFGLAESWQADRGDRKSVV